MQNILKIVAVVVILVLVLAAGYVVGVAHVMRTAVCVQPKLDGPQPKSIPYPGTICANCYANYPDWWCWLGGCP